MNNNNASIKPDQKLNPGTQPILFTDKLTIFTLGEYLRKNRENAGYTLEQVAKDIGVTRQWISLVETGRTNRFDKYVVYQYNVGWIT